MGKTKKKKFSSPKVRPTGLPSVQESVAQLEETGQLETNTGALQTIVEKLQSSSEEVRECGCATIAGLVSQPGAVRELMKLNVTKILAPLILDPSWDVRLRALGALRNVSVDGGAAVCEDLVRQDVLTPLMALLHQFSKAVEFGEGVKQKSKDAIMELYTHALYLLLNLCENCDIAVKIFNRENVLPVLLPILASPDCSGDLKLAFAQCLHTISEDNVEVSSPGLLDVTQKLMSEPSSTTDLVLLKMLATGILVNIVGSKLTSARGDLVSPIVTAASEVLAVDVAAMLPQQTSQVDPQSDMDVDSAEAEPKAASREKEQMDIRNLLSAQKVALEIITNLSCSEDDEWEDLASSESSLEEGAAGDVQMDQEMVENNLAMPLCVPTELHTAYVTCGVVAKVFATAEPLTSVQDAALATFPDGKSLTKMFVSRQTHALLCVNNLVGALSMEALGGVDKLHDVWHGLVQLAKSPNSMGNQELLEAVTCAMRAVVQKLAETHTTMESITTPGDLQYMREMCSTCQWPEVRVNSVRMVSTLGCHLARNEEPHPLLKDIGVLLLEVVAGDGDLWVVGEALDSIFDMFGEDHVDPVAMDIGLVDKLKTVAPALKAKIAGARSSLGEHYPVVSMARTNLVRFIKYKSAH